MPPPPPGDATVSQTPAAASDPVATAFVAPNVFVAHECARASAPASAIATQINETYAQCNEDLIVEALLSARLALQGRSLASLFYVEIGANHPVQTSNTYLFYRKYRAAGVLVEANAGLIEDLRRVRPRDVVLHTAVSGRTDVSLSFGVCELGELSSLSLDHIRSFGAAPRVATASVPNLHINDLLQRHADRPIDYLSIDAEGVDLEILEALDFARFRPWLIQCEPSEHFAPGTARRMVELLHSRGYTLAARTAVNLIFSDATASTASALRPQVSSFDVFDTLIARRCVDPLRVFDAVEASTGIAGFAQARREAECAVNGPDTTLATIYAELARRLGLGSEAAAALQRAEIDAELAEVIPIAENLAQVGDGDLLLSDMYLPPRVIRDLLHKAGLRREVSLLVTANGKRSGGIWPLLTTSLSIRRHVGDHTVADVAMPRRFNIASEHTRLAEPTPIERWCLEHGLRPVGELIRAARLRVTTPDPLLRRLLFVQTQYNFPLLLLGSLALHEHATNAKATRLLFCSRDAQQWHTLYDALYPDHIPTGYFYTSRRARVQPTADYRRYASAELGEGSILVDLCGSGWSSSRLFDSLGLTGCSLYFLHRIAPVPLYEQQWPMPDAGCIAAMLGPERQGYNNTLLEMCNYSLHGSAIGVIDVAGTTVPLFDDDDRSARERDYVAGQVACFAGMVEDARHSLRTDDIALSAADRVEVAAQLYRMLCQESCLLQAFGASHSAEDRRTLRALKLVP